MRTYRQTRPPRVPPSGAVAALPSSRPAGALGSRGNVTTVTRLEDVSTVSRPEVANQGHLGHRCCLDPRRADRYTLTVRRPGSELAERHGSMDRRIKVIPARCGSYGCPCCCGRNIRRNRKRALMGLRDSEGAKVAGILTATLDPEHPLYRAYLMLHGEPVLIAGRLAKRPTFRDERRASVRFVSRAWSDWVTYVRRFEPQHRCGECKRSVGGFPRIGRHRKGCASRWRPFEGLAFFAGREVQRNGRAHLHVLVRFATLAEFQSFQASVNRGGALHGIAVHVGFGGRRGWRDTAGRVRDGFEVERARSKREVAQYVAKVAGSFYGEASLTLASEVAKVRQQRTLPPKCRRASWSMGRRAWASGWRRRLSDGSLQWAFAAMTPERASAHLAAAGWLVIPGRSPGAVPAEPGSLEAVG